MEEPTSSVYLGNLAPQVTRRHLYEVGIQAGPVVSVALPQESTISKGAVNKGFGFIEYEDVQDAQYAVALFRGNLRLFGREVKVQFGGQPKRSSTGMWAPTIGAQQQGRGAGTPQAGAEERQQQSVARSDSGQQAQHRLPSPQQFVQQQAQQQQQQQHIFPHHQAQHAYMQPQAPMPQSFTFAGMLQASQQQQQHLHMQQAASYAAHGMALPPRQQQQQQYGTSPYSTNGHTQQYGSSPYQAHGQQPPLPPTW